AGREAGAARVRRLLQLVRRSGLLLGSRTAAPHAVLDAGDLVAAVHLHGDPGAVGLGHVRLVGRPLGVGLDALDRPTRDGRLGRGPDLVGGVTGEQYLLLAVGADVAALGRIERGAAVGSVGGRSGNRRRRARLGSR